MYFDFVKMTYVACKVNVDESFLRIYLDWFISTEWSVEINILCPLGLLYNNKFSLK